VGNGFDFATRPPWEITTEFAHRYGPMSLAWLGPMPVVMVHDADAIGRVLVDGDASGDVYKAEPVAALSVLSPPNTSTFVENGVEHQRLRRSGFTARPAFAAWLDDTSTRLVNLARDRAFQDLAQPGPGFDERMFRFMFDAMSVAVTGIELGDAAFADATSLFRTVDFRMRTNLPVLPPTFFATRKRWWDVFRKRVEAERAGHGTGGLIACALPGTRQSLDQFAISMSTVYPGGYFSVTAVILNALLALHQHPEVEDELRRAIADQQRQGTPSRATLASLAPLERVIRETMRRFTPVPIFMRRVGRAPLTLAGHHLAPGTLIAIGPGPLHMSKDQWDEPERFNPARWTSELMAERPYGSPWFFPFGRGGRECEGRQVALTLIRSVLYGCLSRGRVVFDQPSKVTQKYYFAVMMPHKLSGSLVPAG